MKDEASDAPLTYAASGVDYDLMDPFKRLAQQAARATAGNLAHFGFEEVAASRGESAYLIETPEAYLAHVEEGLGTKNLVADAMYRLTGRTFYDAIGQDTVAMIVNDLITVGAMPVSIAMHLAVGTSEWFADAQRVADLVQGFQHACNLARAVWGGGETPTLRKIVAPDTAVLAGSAVGIIRPKERLIRANLAEGDVILFLAASGIHANGLTLAQRIADRLPQGYLTPIGDGRPYGEALLDPTPIYVPVLDDLLAAGIVPHYTANVTGHGWRKLMRASEPFVTSSTASRSRRRSFLSCRSTARSRMKRLTASSTWALALPSTWPPSTWSRPKRLPRATASARSLPALSRSTAMISASSSAPRGSSTRARRWGCAEERAPIHSAGLSAAEACGCPRWIACGRRSRVNGELRS